MLHSYKLYQPNSLLKNTSQLVYSLAHFHGTALHVRGYDNPEHKRGSTIFESTLCHRYCLILISWSHSGTVALSVSVCICSNKTNIKQLDCWLQKIRVLCGMYPPISGKNQSRVDWSQLAICESYQLQLPKKQYPVVVTWVSNLAFRIPQSQQSQQNF